MANADGMPLLCPCSYNRPQPRALKFLPKTSLQRLCYDALFFLPTTPNDQLQTLIQLVVYQEVAQLKLSVKCVSTSGVSIWKEVCLANAVLGRLSGHQTWTQH